MTRASPPELSKELFLNCFLLKRRSEGRVASVRAFVAACATKTSGADASGAAAAEAVVQAVAFGHPDAGDFCNSICGLGTLVGSVVAIARAFFGIFDDCDGSIFVYDLKNLRSFQFGAFLSAPGRRHSTKLFLPGKAFGTTSTMTSAKSWCALAVRNVPSSILGALVSSVDTISGMLLFRDLFHHGRYPIPRSARVSVRGWRE